MKKFMIIYHMPESALEGIERTAETREEGMKQWFDWRDRMGDKLLDFGSPLSYGTKIAPDGSTSSDGSNVAGYSIIQAESLEDAQKLLEGHPHLGWSQACDLVLHEYMEM